MQPKDLCRVSLDDFVLFPINDNEFVVGVDAGASIEAQSDYHQALIYKQEDGNYALRHLPRGRTILRHGSTYAAADAMRAGTMWIDIGSRLYFILAEGSDEDSCIRSG